jgi:hypothetical protein
MIGRDNWEVGFERGSGGWLRHSDFQNESSGRSLVQYRCGVFAGWGKSHRPGLYQCNACREPFTVTVGTPTLMRTPWLAAGAGTPTATCS